MSTYVLVHGSWHGAWCWDKLRPMLEKAGHAVVTPELPGHGKDTTPVREITAQSYVDCVGAALQMQKEPVILVGHSMAGLVISMVAEQFPDRIKSLVYLAAYLIPDGQSALQQVQTDTEGLITPNLIMSEDGSYATLREDAIPAIFYHDCSQEDVAWARSRLVGPHPSLPLVTPIHVTEENFGRIPRVYITCLQDKALVPAVQRKMYTALPCDRVFSLDTSHSPFLSAPEELAGLLLAAG